MPLLALTCLTSAGITAAGGGVLFKRIRNQKAHDQKLKDARDGKITMCLPHGQDRYGRTLLVEVLDVGILGKFPHEDKPKLVPVTIEHINDDKINVKWGHKDNTTWALLGRHFLASERTTDDTITGPREVMWAPLIPSPGSPETAPATSAKVATLAGPEHLKYITAPAPSKFWGFFNFKRSKRGLASHMVGSRYNP